MFRNPWDYPPTDGFTDTYEYSKGMESELNNNQVGFDLNKLTSLDESDLLYVGAKHYLAGVESYAFKYFQGCLFGQGNINFNQLTGTESLIASLGEKIKQFFKWLVNLFTKDKTEMLTKTTPFQYKGEPPSTETDKEKVVSLSGKFEALSKSWVSHIDNLLEVNKRTIAETEKLKALHPSVYTDVKNLNDDELIKFSGYLKSNLAKCYEQTKHLTTSKDIIKFGRDYLEMLWRSVINFVNARLKIDSLDVIKKLGASTLESNLKARVSDIPNADQTKVTNNLLDITNLTVKFSKVSTIIDLIDKVRADLTNDLYFDKR